MTQIELDHPTAPWTRPVGGAQPRPDVTVAIIGAGLSGLGMAAALLRAGIDDIVILERAGEVGGTWRDNTYPGVGVDVPAISYQFSYFLNPGWSRAFAKGGEVQAYVLRFAEAHGLRRFIRFDAEVRSRRWDGDRHLWRLETPAGEVTARFVVSAIGPFVDPKPVPIPGIGDFAGDVLHSARWDHTVTTAGRRIAVVGTGASAVQLVPELAKSAAHLDVYQRTPIWVAPKPDYPVPGPARALLAALPAVNDWLRRQVTAVTERNLIGIAVNYQGHERRVATMMQLLAKGWYRTQVRDRATREALTPHYGLGCKRPAVSNQYLRTFNRPNVTLRTDPIERVTAEGIRTAGGDTHPADVLVLATGHHLSADPAVFRRTPVQGEGGFDLAEYYEHEHQASYESISMPGLPNHFMIFGPYGWTGGTWHQLVESASIHILRVINEALRTGATYVQVRSEATERWTGAMKERLSRSIFARPACTGSNSYYIDAHGDPAFLRPTSAANAFRSAKRFPLADYRFARLGAGEITPC